MSLAEATHVATANSGQLGEYNSSCTGEGRLEMVESMPLTSTLGKPHFWRYDDNSDSSLSLQSIAEPNPGAPRKIWRWARLMGLTGGCSV